MTKKKGPAPFNEERWKAQVLRRADTMIVQAKVKRSMARPGLEARNLLHLLDLKAAGHSPRLTELYVPREGGL
jgi:hypothetical protein